MSFIEEIARDLGAKSCVVIVIALMFLSFICGGAFAERQHRNYENAKAQQKLMVIEAVKEALRK